MSIDLVGIFFQIKRQKNQILSIIIRIVVVVDASGRRGVVVIGSGAKG